MPRLKHKTVSGGSFGRRVRAAHVVPDERRPRRWPVALAAAGIFLVALFVRFYGLSHDLDEGKIYHPDTPKQIDAAQRFLRGHYYYKSKDDNHDIDGYPFFNMHLVEYEWRGIAGVESVLEYLMGWRREVARPHEYSNLRMKLFVLTRISVCVMSALAVLVIYRIGLETWGVLVGLLGAGLAAVSWLNVETAHYAMTDSVMDLFVCLTVLVAIRMFKSERLVYPLLAGFLSALAFAAKYNGGIVFIFIVLLHVLKYASSGRRLLGARAMRDAGLLVAGALIGVVAAIPSLLIYPDRVAKGIVLFSRLASRFREMPEAVTGGRGALFLYAARLNFSTVMETAGLIMVVGAVAGFVISAFRRLRHTFPGLFVLMYFALVLLSARYVKPYYFSVVTLFFCLYLAVVTDWLAGLKNKLRLPGIALGTIIAAAALITSTLNVARSNFFFWHMSSRRVATAWVNENIPGVFRIREGDYSLCAPGRFEENPVETLALAASSLRPPEIPEGSVPLKEFELEKKRPITWFRNPSVDIWLLAGSEHLRAGFSMPAYQRLPSMTGNEFVFPEGAEFLRSGRFVPLSFRATRQIFIIPECPDEIVIAVRNGHTGNLVTFSFGGQKREVPLKPLETRILTIRSLKRMAVIGRPFYKFWARGAFPCQAEVAVTDEQKGVLYYGAAMYEDALPYLVAAWQERPGVALAQMITIAAACSGQDLDELEQGGAIKDVVQRDLAQANRSLFERFGISSLYLKGLPYIELEAEELEDEMFIAEYGRDDPRASGDTCIMPGPSKEGTWAARLAGLFLEPGTYRVILSARLAEPVRSREPKTFSVSFVDSTGQIVYDRATLPLDELVGPIYRNVECSLRFTDRLGPVTLEIAADPDLPLRIDRVTIKPDVVRTVEARTDLARALLDENPAGLVPEPQHVEPLLAYGKRAEVAGHVELALAAYEKAAEADAGSYRPYEGMRRILERLPEERQAGVAAKLSSVRTSRALPPDHKVSVRFKNGAVLNRYRLSSSEYAPGDTVRMTLYWNVPPEAARCFAGQWLFIHFVPEGAPRNQQAFQGDTAIIHDFRFNERLDRVRPVYRHRVKISEDVPPGNYDIEVGIQIEMHNKRIRVIDADVPHTNNSATIGRLRVVASEEFADD